MNLKNKKDTEQKKENYNEIVLKLCLIVVFFFSYTVIDYTGRLSLFKHGKLKD